MKKILLALILVVTISNIKAQEKAEQFFKAAKANNIEALKTLINEGIEIDIKSDYGATALFFAVDKGNYLAAELLLQNGANPNVRDAFYQSKPFEWSVFNNDTAIVELLIKHGADYNTPWIMGYCVGQNYSGMVKLLLKNKAPGLENAFQVAIQKQNIELVSLMIADSALNDTVLNLALITAMGLGNKEIASILENHGAIIPESFTQNIDSIYQGTYINESFKIKIALNNKQYYISFGSGEPQLLKYEAEHNFSLAADNNVKFKFNLVDELIVSFDLIEVQRTTTFARIFENKPETEESLYKDIVGEVEKKLNWNSFRGINATGIADGQFPPVKWDANNGLNLKWKTTIPGLAHACPINWEDRIFIVTAIGQDSTAEYRVGLYGDVKPVSDTSVHSWKIYCLQKQTGKIIWEKLAYKKVPRVLRHTKATHANSTPVTNGKYVIALFGSEGMVCYTMKGEEKWRIDLGVLDAGWFFEEETQWGHSSSPIIYKNTVIVQVDRSKDSYIAAYNIETGKEIWKTNRNVVSSWGTPAVFYSDKGNELIANGTKQIKAYNPDTGEELWSLGPNSEVTVATPVITDNLIFVTAGYRPKQPIYAIKPGGKGDISIADSLNKGDFIEWRYLRGGTYMPSPIAYKGYFYTLANNGVVNCYDVKTGEKMYRKSLKGGAFTASVVAADGKLYCTSEEKGVFVIKAGPEFEIIANNPIGETCLATPSITDEIFIVRGQHSVFAFSRK